MSNSSLGGELLIGLLIFCTIFAIFLLPSWWFLRKAKQAVKSIDRCDFQDGLLRYQQIQRAAERLPRFWIFGRVFKNNCRFIAAQGLATCYAGLKDSSSAIEANQRAIELLEQGVRQPALVVASVHASLCKELASENAKTNQERIQDYENAMSRMNTVVIGMPREDLHASLQQIRLMSIGGGVVKSQMHSRRVLEWLADVACTQKPLLKSMEMRVRISEGQLAIIRGDYDSAKERLSPILGDFSQPLDQDIAAEAWGAMSNLSLVTNNFPGHIEACQRSLQLHEQDGSNQWLIAASHGLLANAHSMYGNYAEMLASAKQAYQRLAEFAPPDNESLLTHCLTLGFAHRYEGRYDEFDRRLTEVEAHGSTALLSKGIVLPHSQLLRGLYHLEIGNVELAVETLHESCRVLKELRTERDQVSLEFDAIYASALIANQQSDQAQDIVHQIEQELASSKTLNANSQVDLRLTLSAFYRGEGRLTEADRRLTESHEILEGTVHPNHRSYSLIYHEQGVIDARTQNHQSAINRFERSESNRLSTATSEHPMFVPLYRDWAKSLDSLGESELARQKRAQVEAIVRFSSELNVGSYPG